MPAPTTISEFLELVRKSGLLKESDLDDVLSRHRASGTLPTTLDQTATLLVREALITFFQAKQLKLGRYKRFTIGTKYRLLELIGAGGMGAVYLCEHTWMKRLVALKVLPVEKLEDASNLERFQREARAVAALDHPNIVRAYDIDQYEKLHFLVMEYVDGSSLQEVIARYVVEKRQFDPIRAAHYIAQAAVGMQHAHELGMVHRDIKPGNLLLDRSGIIKILDMGLARFFHKQADSVTEKYDDKCVLGTADYLAPEQAVSNIVDIRADIYALGGTLYFMLTGQTPFPDGTIAAKLVAHQTREPKPVEAFRSDVPVGLLAVLRRMMAKDKRERYQQPIEVAEALAEWADQPISPPPTREMPIHCPLVQKQAGPMGPGSGTASPLARVLFGPGRGIFTRSGGSSRRTASAETRAGGMSTANYGNPTGNPESGADLATDGSAVSVGPVSTARASASPTTPVPSQPRSDPPSGSQTAPQSGSNPALTGNTVVVIHHRRTGLYITIGVLFTLLFLVGAVAAYYIGKGNNSTGGTTPSENKQNTGESKGTTPSLETIQPPTAEELALSPASAAAASPGSIVLVEFKVHSSDASPVAHLNSSKSFHEKGNFSVNVQPVAFTAVGKTTESLLKEYDGKTIRVRGKLGMDKSGNLGIDVWSMNQLLIVEER